MKNFVSTKWAKWTKLSPNGPIYILNKIIDNTSFFSEENPWFAGIYVVFVRYSKSRAF